MRLDQAESTLHRVRKITCVAFFLGLVLSGGLWLVKPLLLPRVPVFSAVAIPYTVDALMYFLLLLLIAVLYFRESRLLYVCILMISIVFALEDQLRWRVAFYIYLLILVGLFFRISTKEQQHGRQILNGFRLVFVAVYFWAGIHKLNIGFMHSVFPWMLREISPSYLYDLLAPLGLFAAILETSLALGLLVPKLRKPSVLGLISMHVIILLCIGPVGQNWNQFVWPWNVAMAAFVFTIFWGWEGNLLNQLEWKLPYQLFLYLLVVIAPALNLLGYWDDYPSFHLYSGATPEASLISTATSTVAPNAVISRFAKKGSNGSIVPFTKLVSEQVGMTPYPSRRYYLGLYSRLCTDLGNSYQLEIKEKPRFLATEIKVSRYDCRGPVKSG